jgi:hypothetical protein
MLRELRSSKPDALVLALYPAGSGRDEGQGALGWN